MCKLTMGFSLLTKRPSARGRSVTCEPLVIVLLWSLVILLLLGLGACQSRPEVAAGAAESAAAAPAEAPAAERGPGDQAFMADREVLFARCSVIPLYTLGPGGSVRRVGESRLTPLMRESVESLLLTWERYGDGDKRKLAYVLGTAFRESRGTLQPIREAPSCGMDEGCRERAIGRLLQERAAGTSRPPRANYALPDTNGRRYYGRGYVQLTLRGNYRRMGDHLGISLEESPDLALDPAIASVILVRGMIDGRFTGRSLNDYFNGPRADWVTARNIVSPGSPHKPITAQHGRDFDACLVPASRLGG